MSAAEITRFNKDVLENKGMMEELKKIGNDVPKLVAYAKSKGYDFTVEDLNKKQGELSDEKLDKVAGGGAIADVSGIIVG